MLRRQLKLARLNWFVVNVDCYIAADRALFEREQPPLNYSLFWNDNTQILSMEYFICIDARLTQFIHLSFIF